jgi:hypothetical protein
MTNIDKFDTAKSVRRAKKIVSVKIDKKAARRRARARRQDAMRRGDTTGQGYTVTGRDIS